MGKNLIFLAGGLLAVLLVIILVCMPEISKQLKRFFSK
jgi:hypothetical protein